MLKTAYLTGASNPWAESLADEEWGSLGLLLQPGNHYHRLVDRYPFWAADNGCFSSKGFSLEGWWTWLEELVAQVDATGACWDRHELHGDGEVLGPADICLFATAPDVVGDCRATLERSLPWLGRIRELGLPAAFVAQDGCEVALDDYDEQHLVPWDHFDVLFLGGSTEWKLDPERAGRLVVEAKRRGKGVHMGRVNSGKRFHLAESWGCDTADGTFLAFGPKANLPRLAEWLRPALRALVNEWLAADAATDEETAA